MSRWKRTPQSESGLEPRENPKHVRAARWCGLLWLLGVPSALRSLAPPPRRRNPRQNTVAVADVCNFCIFRRCSLDYMTTTAKKFDNNAVNYAWHWNWNNRSPADTKVTLHALCVFTCNMNYFYTYTLYIPISHVFLWHSLLGFQKQDIRHSRTPFPRCRVFQLWILFDGLDITENQTFFWWTIHWFFTSKWSKTFHDKSCLFFL